MMFRNSIFIAFGLFFSALSFAQIQDYNFKHNLENVTETWHSITLPNALFAEVKPNLTDIRVIGITVKNDTIEAPYILKYKADKSESKSIPFKIINTSKTSSGYYFTFQMSEDVTINQIKLNFESDNFDWKINLEGSQNLKEWFTILENYRILSIKNANTNYSFTTLNFPEAKYRYFRVFVKTVELLKLNSSAIFKQQITKGVYNNHKISATKISDDKDEKITQIDFDLNSKLPVNSIALSVKDDFDYYRPIKIEYLADSLKTEKGWNYNYRQIFSGTLNSLEPNQFNFTNVIASKFRITIYNYDNQPLSIGEVTAKGYKYNLITRFTEDADYSLVYGNKSAKRANYDISRFETAIPTKNIKALKFGEQIAIAKPQTSTVSALFENKFWLWGIMILVIFLLGFFTVKMLKNN